MILLLFVCKSLSKRMSQSPSVAKPAYQMRRLLGAVFEESDTQIS